MWCHDDSHLTVNDTAKLRSGSVIALQDKTTQDMTTQDPFYRRDETTGPARVKPAQG
jgi:hypothetical protein